MKFSVIHRTVNKKPKKNRHENLNLFFRFSMLAVVSCKLPIMTNKIDIIIEIWYVHSCQFNCCRLMSLLLYLSCLLNCKIAQYSQPQYIWHISNSYLFIPVVSYCIISYFSIYRLYLLPTPQKRCPGYDSKLHLMVRLYFWSSGECGVPFHCHYSQVYSDLLCYYL